MANLRRRHYKLNSKVIEAVRHLAEYGAALEHIAAAVGVSYEAITLWLRNAKGTDPTEEEIQLLQALNEGRAAGAHKFINIITSCAQDGDSKSAQWMLTHSPSYRKHYSDNAAVTRARNEGIEAAVSAIAEANLTPEQERTVLLRIQAKTGQELVPNEEG
jgi:AcrR family transcriptional regulator